MDDTTTSVALDDDGTARPDGVETLAAPTDDPARRRRRWPFVAGFVVVALVAGALFVPLPYLLYEPGEARSTEARVDISGHQAFTTKGQVLFLTVSEVQATPAGLLQAWLDENIDVEDKDKVYPPGGRDADQILNQARMDESKYIATALAFKAVGYPVNEIGSGAFIDQVLPGYPAAKVLRQGDVIVEVDGNPIRTQTDLTASLAGKPVGTVLQLKVRRGTRAAESRTVELGANKDDTSRGYIGVVPSTAERDLHLPFHLQIDSGKVTGPSAGLAFTLGVIDRLTPGDLTGGKKVAVTGTIDAQGNVGEIGGIVQKAVTLKEAGATEFLYPAATDPKELARVKKICGTKIALHPVATLDEALEILAPGGLPRAPALS